MSSMARNEGIARIARIALVGPMGIGKTTAIRAICGSASVECEAPNLDLAAHPKATTTVGTDFGEVDIGDGDRLQIYGCPGQDRFNFVRTWVLSLSLGVLVMIDLDDPHVLASATAYLDEIAQSPMKPLAILLVARPATDARIESLARKIESTRGQVTVVMQADPRDTTQMMAVLQVLVSMLSLKDAAT